jgi:hypothetical protein
MKVKFWSVIFALSLFALMSRKAQAQDESVTPGELQDPTHQEFNLNEDKTLLVDHDSKSKTTRDSTGTHSKSGVTPAKGRSSDHNKPSNGKEEDDDALSFNFLYYIIQKYKISDLIDD